MYQFVQANPAAAAKALASAPEVLGAARNEVQRSIEDPPLTVPDFCVCGRCQELPEMNAVSERGTPTYKTKKY